MSDKEMNLDIRIKDELQVTLAEADHVLMKSYQYDLSSYPVMTPSNVIMEWDISKHTRLFKIESIAYDKTEDNLKKLSNVYNALSAVGGSVIILLDSDGEQIDFYMGTKTREEKDIYVAHKTLEKALNGNFPGCITKNLTKRKLEQTVNNLFYYRDDSSLEEHRTITAVSGISSMRSFSGNSNKTEFAQGIEKLIDSMRGEVYSLVLIADPIEQRQIDTIRKGYEQLYTKLVPFTSAEISLGYTSGTTLTDSITDGISDTISESLTLSQSHSHTSTTSTTKTNSVKLGSVGHSSSTTKTESDTYTTGKAETTGTSNTKSFSIGLSSAISKGESRNLQIRTEEKSVKSLLERIDIQMKRLSECGDLGMWNCAAYFIADDLQISKTAASTYQALIRGENTGIEAITLNTWSWEEDNDFACNNYQNLSFYLNKLIHPEINIGNHLPIVNPTALISGAELTIQAGLPQKSVLGLAVAQYAAFGREVLLNGGELSSVISLGNVHHMGISETTPIYIDKQSLTSHTFITGSTGAGKSNAVYQILNELSLKGIPFLIIEPAKGEYKHIFGNRKDVNVFGTNPHKMPLLKINPFRFPDDIHVLEHIDRLIEIFNVCWPMYAAMPAILKEAVERAYIIAGWDLETSYNKYEVPLYPTFLDVLQELSRVINESDFSGELKSNYTGALITRVKSLTNGINGQIFVADEIDNTLLFDRNTIIDLSRVASMETKAMIMGILIMRLQEYRMAAGGMNKPLQHITVLEEAHNLLKRTSTEQSSEGANLLGKSVEMLSQSIAEMRTYGEGFIIADQSPHMLDMSVIRNTNTKIILRLPDLSDRELCGRAANLNDEQIVELAKLPTGVAAVYQNNWIEPVLCKINKYEEEINEYSYQGKILRNKTDKLKETLIRCLLSECVQEKVKYFTEDLVEQVIEAQLPVKSKLAIIKALRNKSRHIDDVKTAITSLFDTSTLLKGVNSSSSIKEFNEQLMMNLKFDFDNLHMAYKHATLRCIIKEVSATNPKLKDLHDKWVTHMKQGEVE